MPEQTWPPGPWDDEPDRVPWTDPATGLPCIVLRSYTTGAWCGYCAVPPSHPCHGAGYDDPDVSVHGGLTYAAGCDGDPEGGVCHIPPAGQPDDMWWFGFDCGHCYDVVPLLERQGCRRFPGSVYRDLGYVTAETGRLAAQLHALR
jgi:hypothetical protein